MLHGRFALPGITALKPLSQGSLSSLCGLYSAMNGIRLALYPQRLSKRQTEELYRQGATHLARARQLARVLGVGMPQDKWIDLTRSLLAHANDATGSSLYLKQILSRSARGSRGRAVGAIRQAVVGGSPVLVRLGGALNHFTVIAGFTDQRLLLFDSSGLRWIETDSVGMTESSGRRHWLDPDSVGAVTDDW